MTPTCYFMLQALLINAWGNLKKGGIVSSDYGNCTSFNIVLAQLSTLTPTFAA